MSIYSKSVPCQLRECFVSLLGQTVQANQYVLLVDGPIGKELNDVVEDLINTIPQLEVIRFDKNRGLGTTLGEGLAFCKYDLVARMDADDIAVSDRFEKELRCFEEDDKISVVGGNVVEFIDNTDNLISYRKVPQEHNDICEFLKKRSPFNHMSVMFKKTDVEQAGGYIDSLYCEDYYLWARMYLNGCRFKNLPDVLIKMRIDDDTFRRRGGLKYYKAVKKLFKFMRKNKIISSWQYFKSKVIRFVTYVMMPNCMREWAYRRFVRNKKLRLGRAK